MIRHPDLEPEDIDALSQSIDVAPTVLSALGAASPSEMQGCNLLAPDRPYGKEAMVELELGTENGQGRFETAWQCPPDHCRALAFEKDGYRLAHFATDIAPMLFDVENDPDCTRNLAQDNLPQLHHLRAEALSHRMRKGSI
jgi:arylsulfatase A-like enzyme